MTSLISPDAPDEPVGPEPVATPEPPAPPPAAELPPDPDPDTFSREYVQDLRQENAKYRTRARAYEEAFDGYDDDTQTAILEWVRLQRLASEGDADAAAQLEEMFGGDDEAPASPASASLPSEPAPQYLTMDQARELFREEMGQIEQARAQQDGVNQVIARARDLGYEPGNEDTPPSPDYILLMQFANRPDVIDQPDAMAAADALVKEYKAAIVAEHVGKKEKQADTTPAISQPGAAAQPDHSTRPWTDDMSEAQRFAAVRAAAEARMLNSRG